MVHYFFLIILSFFIISCKPISNQNNFNKLQSDKFNKVIFCVDSIESNKMIYDSIKKLPQIETVFLQNIFPLLDNNMISKDGFTTFHYYKEIKIKNYKGIIVACLSDYNTISCYLNIIIIGKNEEIVASSKLAEYFNESGGEIHLRSIQNSENEFYQTRYEGGVLDDTSGFSQSIHSILKFENNMFKINQIDSTYELIIYKNKEK